jgi:hypothetical protein
MKNVKIFNQLNTSIYIYYKYVLVEISISFSKIVALCIYFLSSFHRTKVI